MLNNHLHVSLILKLHWLWLFFYLFILIGISTCVLIPIYFNELQWVCNVCCEMAWFVIFYPLSYVHFVVKLGNDESYDRLLKELSMLNNHLHVSLILKLHWLWLFFYLFILIGISTCVLIPIYFNEFQWVRNVCCEMAWFVIFYPLSYVHFVVKLGNDESYDRLLKELSMLNNHLHVSLILKLHWLWLFFYLFILIGISTLMISNESPVSVVRWLGLWFMIFSFTFLFFFMGLDVMPKQNIRGFQHWWYVARQSDPK